MRLTQEQIEIIEAVRDNDLVKVEAVSGAGKTSTLIAVANEIQPKTGMYIAYNKAIADEAKTKFPEIIDCRTIHSLAYKYTMNKSRKIEHFGFRNITEDVEYDVKLEVVDAMEQFFLSDSTEIAYLDQFGSEISEIAKRYINKMVENEVHCTFSFILKFFHLMLEQSMIEVPEVDLLMLDEAGDTTGVTLEIFKLLPAKKKIMVGDPNQNIYSFMHTINGFELLKHVGVTKHLSQSFRVSDGIAKRVEKFVKGNFNKDMEFKGIENKICPEINSCAYIARTNATLIRRMIILYKTRTPFNLTRAPTEIFNLPLILMNISKPDAVIMDKKYKHLKDDYRHYLRIRERMNDESFSFFKYLMNEYPEDRALKSAINLLINYTYSEIYDVYKAAKEFKGRAVITVTSAHASKGLEFDEVYIEDDMNQCLPSEIETEEDLTEYKLYYVACTRAKYFLNNAIRLEQEFIL